MMNSSSLFRVANRTFAATKGQMSNKNIETMNQNEQDFERQVRAHKATIYTVCYMFSRDQDEVADLYQECLINLWRSWPNFEHRSDVRTWIYRICLNVCVSLERKKRRHPTIPLTMDINPYEEDNQNSRQMEMLRQRINQLPPIDRAIVLLWLENMSYDEIGAIVGISAKNVSVRLVRIREQLKRINRFEKRKLRNYT